MSQVIKSKNGNSTIEVKKSGDKIVIRIDHYPTSDWQTIELSKEAANQLLVFISKSL